MKEASKKLGTIFILVSTLIFIYIYIPIIKIEIEYRFNSNKPTVTVPKSHDFGIVIDKLGINETITANVDPFNQSQYLPVLTNSIAHASTSTTPNNPGSVFLFAHSSDNPLSITRYNTSFYLLDKLQPGDTVKLYYQSQLYRYIVSDLQVVKPSAVELLTRANQDQLILQTCTPIGTSLNRLIVTAKKV